MNREFLTYGIYSMSYMFTNPETRGEDPFNLIFPKMTKCTLNAYGPSGTIEGHDALCVLAVNIINEKILLFMQSILIQTMEAFHNKFGSKMTFIQIKR